MERLTTEIKGKKERLTTIKTIAKWGKKQTKWARRERKNMNAKIQFCHCTMSRVKMISKFNRTTAMEKKRLNKEHSNAMNEC